MSSPEARGASHAPPAGLDHSRDHEVLSGPVEVAISGIPGSLSLELYENIISSSALRTPPLYASLNLRYARVHASENRFVVTRDGTVSFPDAQSAREACARLPIGALTNGIDLQVALSDPMLRQTRTGPSLSQRPVSAVRPQRSWSRRDAGCAINEYRCDTCELIVHGPQPPALLKETHEGGTRHRRHLRLGPPSLSQAMRPQGEELNAALITGEVAAASAGEACVAFPDDIEMQSTRRYGVSRQYLWIRRSRRRFSCKHWKDALSHVLRIRGLCSRQYFDGSCADARCGLQHEITKPHSSGVRGAGERSVPAAAREAGPLLAGTVATASVVEPSASVASAVPVLSLPVASPASAFPAAPSVVMVSSASAQLPGRGPVLVAHPTATWGGCGGFDASAAQPPHPIRFAPATVPLAPTPAAAAAPAALPGEPTTARCAGAHGSLLGAGAWSKGAT
eukprot:TRINITY_DN6337_c0_g2_i3.p1 TRINITY_DN6337_c0_g2~~TRINITY_DN6337_c0_g2_i3.p1  ORF type:complete len:453 (+),score=-85.78 TRINITY_DN6337_c0_g2_i3:139-1497(+)